MLPTEHTEIMEPVIGAVVDSGRGERLDVAAGLLEECRHLARRLDEEKAQVARGEKELVAHKNIFASKLAAATGQHVSAQAALHDSCEGLRALQAASVAAAAEAEAECRAHEKKIRVLTRLLAESRTSAAKWKARAVKAEPRVNELEASVLELVNAPAVLNLLNDKIDEPPETLALLRRHLSTLRLSFFGSGWKDPVLLSALEKQLPSAKGETYYSSRQYMTLKSLNNRLLAETAALTCRCRRLEQNVQAKEAELVAMTAQWRNLKTSQEQHGDCHAKISRLSKDARLKSEEVTMLESRITELLEKFRRLQRQSRYMKPKAVDEHATEGAAEKSKPDFEPHDIKQDLIVPSRPPLTPDKSLLEPKKRVL